MFLLSEQLVRRYMNRRLIQILDFAEDNLYPTCYYFRLGRMAEVPGDDGTRTVNVERTGYIVIPPHSVASVESFEHFTMSDNTLALLGNYTSFMRDRNLQLLHGPTIDPGWHERLGLAIHNLGNNPQRIEFKDRIGKAMFFDISDSALEEARLTPEALRRERELERRGGN
jgi:deoxycytidine triphosphate deaminase